MSEEIEKLIKIQGAIDKNVFHLFVQTDLEKEFRWELYLYNPNIENYFSKYNNSILSSKVDSVEDLYNYFKKHNGFKLLVSY